jgi:hypothetical protein
LLDPHAPELIEKVVMMAKDGDVFCFANLHRKAISPNQVWRRANHTQRIGRRPRR